MSTYEPYQSNLKDQRSDWFNPQPDALPTTPPSPNPKFKSLTNFAKKSISGGQAVGQSGKVASIALKVQNSQYLS